MRIRSQWCSKAFTRTELIFTVGGIALVLAVLLVAPRWRAQQKLLRCTDNLKNVTSAWILWVEDSDTMKPPWRTPVDRKGTLGFEPAAFRSECWFQMTAFSNQLSSPKFLADPADKGSRVAHTWSHDPESGLAAPEFRDNACSYPAALDFSILDGWVPPDSIPNSLLFSDRNLGGNSTSKACSAGITATTFEYPFDVAWSKEVHGSQSGNVGLIDGSVASKSGQDVKKQLRFNVDHEYRIGSAHFLFPRRSSSGP